MHNHPSEDFNPSYHVDRFEEMQYHNHMREKSLCPACDLGVDIYCQNRELEYNNTTQSVEEKASKKLIGVEEERDRLRQRVRKQRLELKRLNKTIDAFHRGRRFGQTFEQYSLDIIGSSIFKEELLKKAKEIYFDE